MANTVPDSLAILSLSGHIPDTVQESVRVVGIDLGTTNSTIAETSWSRGSLAPPIARCLEVEQMTDTGPYTNILVPSVVSLRKGQAWVGEGAKRLRADATLRRNRDIFYECKNDMGARRTYHRAPSGFRSAAEIAGKLLAFLGTASIEPGSSPPDRVVVTVPASFQLAQRNDTLIAAKLAGLDLKSGDLLDEPVAAFIDYLVTHRDLFPADDKKAQNLLVFDFGGGTCDVAVLRALFQPVSGSVLTVSPLAVSRYHRLGGGDIDAAIVHDILIPQLIEQNQLDPHSIDFDARKRHLEPALLGVAEALKVGLCIETSRLRSFGRYSNADKTAIIKTHPGAWPCPIPEQPSLLLRSPQLTALQFEELLIPFLDTDLLYARETEYHLTCSIFAPVQDALDRAGLRPADIHLCLLVGGSSLIPQVEDAVRAFFPSGRTLTYEDRDSTQVAVARGAALHALALAMFGRGMIQPVTNDAISIRAKGGLVALIPRGSALPFPRSDHFLENFDLSVPETVISGNLRMRVELVSGDDASAVFGAIWEIPGPVNRGESLRLGIKMDGNQCLHLEMKLRDSPDAEPFVCVVENPLTNVVNPHATRQRIEEVEEDLRTGKIDRASIPKTLASLASDYAELNQPDKAIDYIHQALRIKKHPDATLLNALGIRYGEKGDWARQEKYYREAYRVSPHWPGPLFNLALSEFNRNRLLEAEVTVDEAITAKPDPAYFVLRAMILEKRGSTTQATAQFEDAVKRFGPVTSLQDWDLGWFLTAAHRVGDKARADQATTEQQRRRKTTYQDNPDGFLPEIAPGLRKL